jgi:hypothetical protein
LSRSALYIGCVINSIDDWYIRSNVDYVELRDCDIEELHSANFILLEEYTLLRLVVVLGRHPVVPRKCKKESMIALRNHLSDKELIVSLKQFEASEHLSIKMYEALSSTHPEWLW